MSGKLKTVLTLCLCLLPVAWSFAISVQASQRHGEFQHELKRPLAMHIYMVHLREFDLREGKAIAKFDFHNAAAKSIIIKNIKPSCGCIQVRMHEQGEPIAPGEERSFYLEVDTVGETSGLHEYKVRIDYQQQNDGETEDTYAVQSEQVRYRVDVPKKKVTVRPRALIFYQLSQQETAQTIELIDFRPESKFEITNIQTDSEYLTTGKEIIGQDQYGHMQISIPVTAKESVPSGKHTGSVVIDTDDPEFPQIRIPVLIYGTPSRDGD